MLRRVGNGGEEGIYDGIAGGDSGEVSAVDERRPPRLGASDEEADERVLIVALRDCREFAQCCVVVRLLNCGALHGPSPR